MRLRKQFLVMKRLQIGLTLRFLFLALLFAVFIAFEVYITIWPVASGFIPADLITLVKGQILFRVGCFALPVAFVVLAFCLVFTHRVAGPIYRFEQTLDRLARGEDIASVKIRKGDELKEMADKLNAVIRLINRLKAAERQGPDGR